VDKAEPASHEAGIPGQRSEADTHALFEVIKAETIFYEWKFRSIVH
jgi:hypothetical protein